MSISETLNPPKDYIIEARKMAEAISNKSPEAQIEMLNEIKANVVKRLEIKISEIKKT